MTDADLIYNACLRAERRLEELAANLPVGSDINIYHKVARMAVIAIREEIGNGLAKEGR